MNFGIGQILIIAFVVILLFGNVSKILKDVAKGIDNFKKILNKNSKTF
jgi:Sec-independent protein translocase protein TatA